MKISDKLAKKFIDNTISLTEKSKEDVFFRLTDPNILINLAAHILKTTDKKKVTLKDLKEYYEKDWKLRTALFPMIKKIEDKLTGSFVQRIASKENDFHLQSKNFEFHKGKGRNTTQHFKTVDTHVLNLKRRHNQLINSSKKIPADGFVLFEDFITHISLGTKIWTHIHAKEKYKKEIYESFAILEKHRFLFDGVLKEINKLRNILSHHDAILPYEGRVNNKKLGLEQLISIISHMSTSEERKIASSVSSKISQKRPLTKEIKSIYDSLLTTTD